MRSRWATHIAIGTIVPALTLMAVDSFKDASAAMMRTVHAMSCRVAGPGAPLYDVSGQVVNTAAFAIVLVCPVEADNTIAPVMQSLRLGLSGYANSANGIQAKTCVTWWEGGGGICSSSFASSPGAGVVALSVDASAWAQSHGTDYAYVWVQLGSMISGSANVLFGNIITTL